MVLFITSQTACLPAKASAGTMREIAGQSTRAGLEMGQSMSIAGKLGSYELSYGLSSSICRRYFYLSMHL